MPVLRINQIFQGIAPSQYFGQDGTYNTALSIDPDYPITASAIRTSGFAVPVGYTQFSSSNITSPVIKFITNPKNNLTYAVCTNGRLVSYDNSLGSETLVGTVSGNSASGAEYYNNYIYIFGTGASHNDVSRYGPLNNSPTLTDGVWTGSTLGSQAVMSNTTYPTLRSVSIPNHTGHVHGDNALYFCDFESKASGSYPGQGLLHKIITNKTTNEGDTNNGSLYGALRLPFGFYPTAIESYSTSIMIIGIYTTDGNINQGKSAFILWDPTNAITFYQGPVPLPDSLATAILNVDGQMNIWTGNAQNGVRLSQYLGGDSVRDLVYQEEGLPPLQGAVDALGSRIVWGGFSTNPAVSACVYAYGSKDGRLPVGLHNIVKTTSSGANPFITAIKYVQQSSNIQPKIVAGWRDDTTQGIDKYSSSATLGSVIRWMVNVGQRFNILMIRIPLAGVVDSNTTITPTLYFDDLSASKSLTVINNSNFPGKRKAIYKTPELKDAIGDNNFLLELAWTGTTPLPAALPILIEYEIKQDENNQ